MKKKPKPTLKTYQKMWIQNKRMRLREKKLKKIIFEAWRLLASSPKKYL